MPHTISLPHKQTIPSELELGISILCTIHCRSFARDNGLFELFIAYIYDFIRHERISSSLFENDLTADFLSLSQIATLGNSNDVRR